MTDIVERLHALARWSFEQYGDQGYIEEFMEAAAEIETLEAALRECESVAVTHHAEDVSRTDWSGSGMAQKKARAVATRSGLLMHKIMTIARAALKENGDEK